MYELQGLAPLIYVTCYMFCGLQCLEIGRVTLATSAYSCTLRLSGTLPSILLEVLLGGWLLVSWAVVLPCSYRAMYL